MSADNSAQLHASCVALRGASLAFGIACDGAVLLVGGPGSGKSDVALRLIAMGAALVADDQTLVFVKDGVLHGTAPATISGLLEMRGAGIIRLETIANAPILLAVRLFTGSVPRLPEPAQLPLPPFLQHYAPPLVALSPFEASTPAKIAALTASLALGRVVAGPKDGA